MSNKGVVLQGRARDIIYNVIKVFDSEKHHANELLRNLNIARIHQTSDGIPIPPELFHELTEFIRLSVRVTERVVTTTGVNKNTVTRIKREGTEAEAAGMHKISTPVRKTRGKSVVLNDCDLYSLSKVITRLYVSENDVPSLSKIYAKAKSDLNFKGSMTTLRRILVEQLGYKFTKGLNQTKQITIIRPNMPDGCSSDGDIESEYSELEIEANVPEDIINISTNLTGVTEEKGYPDLENMTKMKT